MPIEYKYNPTIESKFYQWLEQCPVPWELVDEEDEQHFYEFLFWAKEDFELLTSENNENS